MNKAVLPLLALITIISAQTTVNYNADLYEVGAVFTNRVVQDASFDPGPAGVGSWDFTSYTGGDTSSFTSVAYDAGIPHIDECAVTPNYILYYHTFTDTSEIEGWGFSYVDPSYVDGLGLHGTMDVDGGSSYFLWTINDSYTHAHEFPIDYGDSWIETIEGHGEMGMDFITLEYEVEDTNWYNVDGYGTIVMPTGTYNALRVKKRHWRHSWSDHWLYGFDKVERRVSYLWFCTELGNAVTFAGPIDSTGGQPDSTFTTGNLTIQVYNSALGIGESSPSRPEDLAISAYPNPFNSSVKIILEQTFLSVQDDGNGQTGMSGLPVQIEVYDMNGRRIDVISMRASAEEESPTYPNEISRQARNDSEGGVRNDSEGGVRYDSEGGVRYNSSREFDWRPSPSLGSGVYLVRAIIGERSTSKRIVYLK